MVDKEKQLKEIKEGTYPVLKRYIQAHRDKIPEEIKEASKLLSDYIMGKVKDALNALYTHDIVLLKQNMNEVTVCGRLAIYLQKEFKDFLDYYIDMEYYRLKKPRETADLRSDRIRCDLLLHSRQGYEPEVDNLLAIEVKLSRNPDEGELDRSRLAELVFPETPGTPPSAIHSTLIGLYLRLGENGYCSGIFTSEGYTKMPLE